MLAGVFGGQTCLGVTAAEERGVIFVNEEKFSFDAVGQEAVSQIVRSTAHRAAKGGSSAVLLFGPGAREALEGCEGTPGLLWLLTARLFEERREAALSAASGEGIEMTNDESDAQQQQHREQQRNGSNGASSAQQRPVYFSWLELQPNGFVHCVFPRSKDAGRVALNAPHDVLRHFNEKALAVDRRNCSVASLHFGDASVSLCIISEEVSLDSVEAAEAAENGGVISSTPRGMLGRILGLTGENDVQVVSLLCLVCQRACGSMCCAAAVALFKKFGRDGTKSRAKVVAESLVEERVEQERVRLRQMLESERDALQKEQARMTEEARARETATQALLQESREREQSARETLQRLQGDWERERELVAKERADERRAWESDKHQLRHSAQDALKVLQEQLVVAQREARVLSERLQQQSREVADLNAVKEAMKAELQTERSLHVQKSAMQQHSIEELKGEVARLTERHEAQENMLRQQDRRLEEMTKLDEANAALQKRIKQAETERDASLEQLRMFQRQTEQQAALQRENLEKLLRDREAELVKKFRELESDLQQKSRENDALRSIMDSEGRNRSELTARTEREIQDLRTALANQQKDAKAALDAAARSADALDRRLKDSERLVRESERALATAQEELRSLQEERKRLQESDQETKKKLKQTQKKCDTQVAQIAELKQLLSAASEANLAMERQLELMLRADGSFK